jgi:protein-L-isoaspartate(D-aspartate) O-methyltransferase
MAWLLGTLLASCISSWSAGPAQDTAARFVEQRQAMVSRLAAYDPAHPINDPRVLDAMRQIPRHLFVPKHLVRKAYEDAELSIGKGQTISPPFIVAYMIQTMELKAGDKVLEIGTGSGYQAAVLSRLAGEIYTIEIQPALAKRAEKTLHDLGYANVWVRHGDGYRGWPQKAPFDAIIVTCAPDHIPQPLVEQLAMGGRLLIPVGVAKTKKWATQTLVIVRKTEKGMVEERRLSVRFLPMKGEAARHPSKGR